MNSIDIAILVALGLYLLGRVNGGSKAKTQESDTLAKDTQLAAEEKPVPTITVGPPPTSTAFTPGQATSYWNKELGENK
jgi:hypothetical protein